MCIEHRWRHPWNWRVPEDFANTNCALPRMQVMTGLTPVVELPVKGAVLLFHHPIPAVFSSLFTIFAEWHWKFCGMALLICLEIRFSSGFRLFWWDDFQAWSLTWSNILSWPKEWSLKHMERELPVCTNEAKEQTRSHWYGHHSLAQLHCPCRALHCVSVCWWCCCSRGSRSGRRRLSLQASLSLQLVSLSLEKCKIWIDLKGMRKQPRFLVKMLPDTPRFFSPCPKTSRRNWKTSLWF